MLEIKPKSSETFAKIKSNIMLTKEQEEMYRARQTLVKFLDYFRSLDEFQHLTKRDVADIFNDYIKHKFVLDDKFDLSKREHVENFWEFICFGQLAPEFARVYDAP